MNKEKILLKQIALNFKNEEAVKIAIMSLQLKNEFLRYLKEGNKPEFEKYKREKEQFDLTIINHSYVKPYMIMLLREFNKLYNL